MHSKSDTDLQRQDDSKSTIQDRTYSIGETAKMIGTTIKTIRYYDQVGLIKPTNYTEGGHRLYTTEDIWRLELITTLRYLDFGIDDIRKMMSGEIQVDKALDWQIEALETQVSTLTNMISILQQAKGHESTRDSLHYIYDLVNSRAISNEKRNQFIFERVEASKILDGVPKEWREIFFHLFNKYIMNEVKLTAKQTVAWNELQELMNDPQYIATLYITSFRFLT